MDENKHHDHPTVPFKINLYHISSFLSFFLSFVIFCIQPCSTVFFSCWEQFSMIYHVQRNSRRMHLTEPNLKPVHLIEVQPSKYSKNSAQIFNISIKNLTYGRVLEVRQVSLVMKNSCNSLKTSMLV
ncbi:hypothetical protein ACOSQ2_001730 [Xanthoceras sorbifolium]